MSRLIPPYRVLVLLTGSLMATTTAHGQAIWYVDDDGDAVNGCTSWADACPDL
ncbi:MAG: hypothetical protein ACYSVY_20510 [Planctomycetota bacterium]|jgi:hypothetical protein